MAQKTKAARLGDSGGNGLFALIRQRGDDPDPIQATGTTVPVTTVGVERIALAALRLDLSQPRRPLPRKYAERVNAGDYGLPDALHAWSKDTGVPLDPDATTPTAALKGAWAELDDIRQTLARSIRDTGLINPITVLDLKNGTYQIETGERRTLAYSLLAAAGQSDFDAIPARIVDTDGKQLSRRQLDENDQRKDLTAVHRARVVWGVRYRLSNLTLDWGRFAGKSNLNALLEKPERGALLCEWQTVAAEMSMTPGRISQIIQVFELPAAAIELAEANGYSEKLLRPLIIELRGKPELQIRLLEAAAAALAAGEGFSAERMRDEVALALAGQQTAPGARAQPRAEATLLLQSRRAFAPLGKLLGDKPTPRTIQSLAQTLLTDSKLTQQVLALKPLIEALAAGAEAAAKDPPKKPKK